MSCLALRLPATVHVVPLLSDHCSNAPEDLLLCPAFAPKPKSIQELQFLDEMSIHEIQAPQQFQSFLSLQGTLCHVTDIFNCIRCYFFFFPQSKYNRNRDYPFRSRNCSVTLAFHSVMLGGCFSNTLLLTTQESFETKG